MEDTDYVLCHKEHCLFIRLTFTRSRKKKPQWEFTTELHLATGFPDIHKAEERQRKHKVPPALVKPIPYTAAHTRWLRSKEIIPHNAKQTELL